MWTGWSNKDSQDRTVIKLQAYLLMNHKALFLVIIPLVVIESDFLPIILICELI